MSTAPLNLHTPHRAGQLARINARYDEHITRRSAYISRMACAAKRWAGRPQDQWCELAFLEAASFVIGSDLEDEISELRLELRVDDEGYRLTDEGDRDERRDRAYVPMEAL